MTLELREVAWNHTDSVELRAAARGDRAAVRHARLRTGPRTYRRRHHGILRGLRGRDRGRLRRGHARLVLETGDEQPDAIRFYEREGFTPIPNFGYYVDSPYSVCFEKPL